MMIIQSFREAIRSFKKSVKIVFMSLSIVSLCDIEWDLFNNSFRSYLMCFSRNRLTLWSHIFFLMKGHLKVIFKNIPLLKSGSIQRGIWGWLSCIHCPTCVI